MDSAVFILFQGYHPAMRSRWLAPGILLWMFAVAAPASPAWAATDDAFIEVHPGTVEPGMQVSVHASCGEPVPGTVSSRAFRDLRLEPPPGTPVMTAHVTVPPGTRPGSYQVRLRCADGAFATVDLHVIDMARPSLAPATGGGGTASGHQVTAWLLAGGLAAFAAGVGLLLRRRQQV
jgi:hypothetical protein